jgi:hypothetical protein
VFQVLALGVLNGWGDIAQQVSDEPWRWIYAGSFNILSHFNEGESVGSSQLPVFI